MLLYFKFSTEPDGGATNFLFQDPRNQRQAWSTESSKATRTTQRNLSQKAKKKKIFQQFLQVPFQLHFLFAFWSSDDINTRCWLWRHRFLTFYCFQWTFPLFVRLGSSLVILCSSHLSFKPSLSFSFWLLWACSAHTLLLTSRSSVSLLKTPVCICFQQVHISLSQRAVLMSSADNTSVSVITVLASVLVLLSAGVESFWCSTGSVFLIKTCTLSAFCMLPVYTVFLCCSNKGNSDPHFANVKWRSEVPLSPINSGGKGSSAAAVLGIQQSLWSSHLPWRGESS